MRKAGGSQHGMHNATLHRASEKRDWVKSQTLRVKKKPKKKCII